MTVQHQLQEAVEKPQAAVEQQRPMQVRILREAEPRLIAVDNFATDAEMREVIRLGEPLLQPSRIQPGRAAPHKTLRCIVPTRRVL